MLKPIFTALLLSASLLSLAQSFEGTLTYKVEFDIKTQKIGSFEITEEQVIQKMKSDGDYYDELTVTIKQDHYKKVDNSDLMKRIIYDPKVNKVYVVQKDFEYVVITDASKANPMNLDYPEPSLDKVDSTLEVMGHECALLKLDWGKTGTELYFYNSDFLQIDPNLYAKHQFEHLGEVLNETGAYPMQIVKTLSNFISIKMTLVSVSEGGVADSEFDLPEMLDAEDDYAETMKKLTGADVKKIKE